MAPPSRYVVQEWHKSTGPEAHGSCFWCRHLRCHTRNIRKPIHITNCSDCCWSCVTVSKISIAAQSIYIRIVKGRNAITIKITCRTSSKFETITCITNQYTIHTVVWITTPSTRSFRSYTLPIINECVPSTANRLSRSTAAGHTARTSNITYKHTCAVTQSRRYATSASCFDATIRIKISRRIEVKISYA